MLWVAFALSVFSGAAGAAQLFGKVVAVADGDTLTLLDALHAQHKIRLSGIDAPERRQPYGQDAKHHLSVLIYGRWVLVTWKKRDRYGRIVGRVLGAACARPECPHTVDVGLEQMKAGLAWHYKQFEREQAPPDRSLYAAVEREARAQGAGLWKELAPVPPWEFRNAVRHRPRAKIASISVPSKEMRP